MGDVPRGQHDVRVDRRLTTSQAVSLLVERGRQLAALHAGGRGDPASDVADLGRAVESRLGADVPDVLRRLLATCRCKDPAGRPTAEELVRLALRLPPPSSPRLSWRPPRSAVAAAVFTATALICAVALGRMWGHGGEPATALSAAPTASSAVAPAAGSPTAHPAGSVPSSSPTDWTAVLMALDRAREQVWASGHVERLAAVDTPASPAERRDMTLLRGLRNRGVVPHGWRSRIDRVTVLRSSLQYVRLRFRDSLSAYRLVSHDGRTRHHVGPRGPRWWVVDLRQVDGEWLTWSTQAT